MLSTPETYTPLARLLHASYTPHTRLLHASSTPLTRLLAASYTPRIRLLLAPYTPLTRLLQVLRPKLLENLLPGESPEKVFKVDLFPPNALTCFTGVQGLTLLALLVFKVSLYLLYWCLRSTCSLPTLPCSLPPLTLPKLHFKATRRRTVL